MEFLKPVQVQVQSVSLHDTIIVEFDITYHLLVWMFQSLV